jgi:hypothetical protein
MLAQTINYVTNKNISNKTKKKREKKKETSKFSKPTCISGEPPSSLIKRR